MIENINLEQYLFDKAKICGRPVRANLELSPVCNFDCKFCYIRHSYKEAYKTGSIRPIEFWKQVIAQLQKMGVLIVTLIGGEPLLYEGFKEVYSDLFDQGFLVNITTNGSLINDDVIHLFSEKPPRYVTVSLYGASDESYKRVTGNQHGFSMVIGGIEKMLEAGIPVKLNYVVSEYNKQDFEAIYALKEKYHLPLIADAHCFPASRRAKKVEWQRLSPQECAKYHLAIKKADNTIDYQSYCSKVATKSFTRLEGYHTQRISCYAGSAAFWISWKGDMMPCGFFENLSVPLDPNDMETAWSELKDKVAEIRTSKKCSECENREFCHVCAASMYWESKSFEEAPEYLCKMTQEVIRIATEEDAKRIADSKG